MSLLLYFFISVTSALTVTAIVWALTRRRLYIVVPKLFAHSMLADSGKTVELTIINRGYKTEKDLVAEFDKSMQYTLIAASSPSVYLSGSELHVSRVPGNDEITVIFLAEKGEFSTTSIASLSSEHAKGKVVDKVDEIMPATGTFLGAMLVTILFLGMTFGAGYLVRSEFGADDPPNRALSSKIEVPTELQVLGWTNMEDFVNSSLFDLDQPGRFPISVSLKERNKDIVSVTVRLSGHASARIMVSGKLISPVEDINNVLSFEDYWFHDAIVFPGQTSVRELRAYLPKSFENQIIVASFNISSNDAVVYNLEKTISLSD